MGLKEPQWPAEDIDEEVFRLWNFCVAFPETARMRAAQMMNSDQFLLYLLKLKRLPIDKLSQEEIYKNGELLVLQQDCRTLSKQYSCASLFRRFDLQRQEGLFYKHMSTARQEQEDGCLEAVKRHRKLDYVIRQKKVEDPHDREMINAVEVSKKQGRGLLTMPVSANHCTCADMQLAWRLENLAQLISEDRSNTCHLCDKPYSKRDSKRVAPWNLIRIHKIRRPAAESQPITQRLP